MISNLMKALYIFLYIVPLSIIRYYPFRDQLRISITKVYFIYFLITLVQAIIFCHLTAQPYWSLTLTQLYRTVFGFFFAFLSLFLIKDNIFKQIYVWLMFLSLCTVIFANANFIEARYFVNFAKQFPYLVTNTIVIAQLAVIYLIFFKLRNKITDSISYKLDNNIWRIIWTIPALFYISTYISTGSLQIKVVSAWSYILIRYFSFASMLFVNYILFELIKKTAEHARLSENEHINTLQLTLARENCRILTQHIDQTRQARHDLHHHFAIIGAYVETNNLQKLKEYLSQYSLSVTEDYCKVLCQNETVDLIARYYLEAAHQLGIKTNVQILLPENTNIYDTDLCIVFSNLMENALEACQRQNSVNRFISIKSAVMGQYVVITVDNSFDGDIVVEDNRFLSTKRSGAGIGISSVETVAKKYGGTVQLKYDQAVFQASVMLEMKQLYSTAY